MALHYGRNRLLDHEILRSGQREQLQEGPSQPFGECRRSFASDHLEADPEIEEEIKWNAPTFFFTGHMKPSDPKEYKRYLVVFNLFKKDCIRLVFWGGARADDESGFLQGDYADGRRLAMFSSMQD